MDVIGRILGIDRTLVRRRGAAEAVLVVPGIDIGADGWRAVGRFFTASDYDLFLPDYLHGACLHRSSLAGAVLSLRAFMDAHELARYQRLHVYANILGTWVVNLSLRERPLANLASIVYDRSPIQERVPTIVHDLLPATSLLLLGTVVGDLVRTPYPELHAPGVRVGLVVESRATLLMRLLRRRALRMGPLDFSGEAFGQPHHDLLYVPLSHDGIYTGIDRFGPALLHFFRRGVFPADARRRPYPEDPFRWTGPGCGR